MIIKLQCPYCHIKLQLNYEKSSNKKPIEFVRCFKCKKVFHVDGIEYLHETLEEIDNLQDDNVINEKELNIELDDPDDDDSKKKDFAIIGDILELVFEALDFFF